MSILISDEKAIQVIQELAEQNKQSPEEVVVAAVMAYATNQSSDGDSFWESIIGIGSSGDPHLAEHDEDILAAGSDPMRGWGSSRDDTDSD